MRPLGGKRLGGRAGLTLAIAIGTLALAVGIASAITGQLTYRTCFADTNAAGCAVPAQSALDNAEGVALSRDGKSVYVAAEGDDSISHFRRNTANGNLSFQGCFADTNAEGCSVPAQAALDGAQGVAVSADGRSVYVASEFDDSISHFTRNTSNGNLSFQGCFADTNAEGCSVPAQAALAAPRGVAVSPDNGSVYAIGGGGDSISHFARNTANGGLSFRGCFADTNADGCSVPSLAALNGAFGVAVSPDAGSVYVASGADNSLSHFKRASNGNLSFQGCFADTNAAGCTVPGKAALDSARGVAVSADDRSVYVASDDDDSISHFIRKIKNGNLAFQGCFADTNVAGCAVPGQAALAGARGVTASPDGKSVYLASLNDASISHFRREPPRCAGKLATKVGTERRDVIKGTGKRDVIAALGGNDVVRGRGGKDLICGDTGKDKLVGGRGRDTLRGGRGRDRLLGGKGRDRLFGGPGLDFQRQ